MIVITRTRSIENFFLYLHQRSNYLPSLLADEITLFVCLFIVHWGLKFGVQPPLVWITGWGLPNLACAVAFYRHFSSQWCLYFFSFSLNRSYMQCESNLCQSVTINYFGSTSQSLITMVQIYVWLVSYLGNLGCLSNTNFINFTRVHKLIISSLQTYILSWVFLKFKRFFRRKKIAALI